MTPLFIAFRWLDLFDILLVAVLIFQLYKIVRGTVAIRIFVGIFTIYLFWKIVEALKMELLTEILGQFIGVGVIALIIVFQQEIRKFLLLIGNTRFLEQNQTANNIYKWFRKTEDSEKLNIEPIVNACQSMAKTKTGALIVIEKHSSLYAYTSTGEKLNAKISSALLESIFFKNSPLHDGAAIIQGNLIKAARCVLPVTDSKSIPNKYGLRHRAAVGLSETSDAITIIVSEETGNIAISNKGEIVEIKSANLSSELSKLI